ILRRALGGCRAAVGCCLELGGHTLGKVFELLDQYSTTAEITFHRCGLKQQPQRPSKSNPIESRKNPRDVLSKFANTALWNTVGRWYWLSFHTPLLSSPTAFHHDLVAALPRCDLLRLFRLSVFPLRYWVRFHSPGKPPSPREDHRDSGPCSRLWG